MHLDHLVRQVKEETSVNLDNLDHRGSQVLQEILVQQDQMEVLETRVKRVILDHLEVKV